MTETDAPGSASAVAHPHRGVRRTTLLVALLVTALVVAAAAFSVGRLSTLVDPQPSDTSAEAGFARDMQTHHNQGVELALIIRDGTDDESVQRLAYDITVTQDQQSGQMYAWLELWGLSQAAAEPSMTWMTRPAPTDSDSDSDAGHAHDTEHVAGEPMPGLATSEQISSLTAASGVEAEREFLTLMIAHHQGAVDMAEAVLDRSDNSAVRGFATAVVLSQKSEIDLMTGMLDDRS